MSRIRKGMWVRLSDRVGIVANLDQAEAEVHLTDDAGVTQNIVMVALGSIAQAAFNDIPTPRRPEESVACSLGYL